LKILIRAIVFKINIPIFHEKRLKLLFYILFTFVWFAEGFVELVLKVIVTGHNIVDYVTITRFWSNLIMTCQVTASS
jgi:hypothetical protein